MKLKFLIHFMLLFAVFACNEKKQSAVPHITVNPKIIDLGQVKAFTAIEKTCVVSNDGNGVLEIQNVQSSCSCTKARLSSKKIKPNQSARLRFTFNAPDHVGPTINTICLRNNSRNEFYFIKVKAEIQQ